MLTSAGPRYYHHSLLDQRVPRLFGDHALVRGHGRRPRVFGRVDLLILDGWSLEPLDDPRRSLRPPYHYRHQPAWTNDLRSFVIPPTHEPCTIVLSTTPSASISHPQEQQQKVSDMGAIVIDRRACPVPENER
jgi:hypothetical protein